MKKFLAVLALAAVLFSGAAFAQFQPGDLVSIKLTSTDLLAYVNYAAKNSRRRQNRFAGVVVPEFVAVSGIQGIHVAVS